MKSSLESGTRSFPRMEREHRENIIRRLELNVFPWIGGRPISEVAAPELLTVVGRIEDKGALETAHRTLSNCGQVFRYGVATGHCERDPSNDLRGALPPVKGTNLAATTDPPKLAEILRAMDGYEGMLVVGLPYASHLWCSFDQASCERPSGRMSTLKPRSGATS